MIWSGTFGALVLAGLLASLPGSQAPDDPELRAAVERFFAMQEAEDVDGYLALWSSTAQPPRADQLRSVFESGDERFSDISIIRVMPYRDGVRVRVSVARQRQQFPVWSGGRAVSQRMNAVYSLTYVREGGEWKLLREAPAADDLADLLLEAESAEQRGQLLQSDADLIGDDLLRAIARRASQLAVTRSFAAAQAGFERVLEVARRMGNRKAEAEALQNLGNTFYFQRDFSRALEAYEQRLEIEREREDEEGIASALLGIATIRYSEASYTAALEAYQEALAIQERTAGPAVIATTLISTGNVLYLQGDFEQAIAGYRRSRELYRSVSYPPGEARALEGLARVLIAQGDYAGALQALDGVLAESRATNSGSAQGTALSSIGDIHFRLGNLETARATFEQSRTHFEALADLANVGRLWQATALTDLAAGRFAAAEEEYVKSSAVCGEAADAGCVAGATVGLAFAQAAQDRFDVAVASYRKAVEAFAALGQREQAARAEVGLSQALSGSGAYKDALDAASRARTAAMAIANDDVLWRALVAEARAHRRLGEAGQALAAAGAAVSAVDRLVSSARLRPASPVPRDSEAVFALLAVLQAERGDAVAAFASAERMRTHDLQTKLAASQRGIAPGMTGEERDEERAMAAEVVSLHAQLSREKALPKPDMARLERLARTAAEAAARLDAWHERLFEGLPDLRTWRGLMAPAAREDIERLLHDPSTVLLQFVVDDEDLLVLSARRVGEDVVFAAHLGAVTRRSLAERVATLMQPETLRTHAGWVRAAIGLTDAIAGPMLSTLADATRAIVIPHEVLWRVPFEALPVHDRVVCDSTAVVYASSVTALVRPPLSSTLVPEPSILLAVGAPSVAGAVRERIRQTAPGWMLRPTEGAERELTAVTADLDVDRAVIVTGAELTEPGLRERMGAADVLHLASPFRINAASALFSPVLLAGEPAGSPVNASDDGELEVREIVNLDLRARVAVISDGTAMSMRDAAGDAAVVQWAWRAAGVPALVVSRWAGDEQASDALLRELHRRLAAGEGPEPALAAAREIVRQTGGWSAPFYWAGWLLIDGR